MPPVDPIIKQVIDIMSRMPGVAALAVGGSRSLGTADQKSDYDLIVFELEKGQIDRNAMWDALGRVSHTPPQHTPEMMFGKIELGGREVELFSRRIDNIAGEVAASKNGLFRRSLNPLHPAGFLSTMLISYATYCRPIWDPEGHLQKLIASAHPYPEPLRQKLTNVFRVEAKIALMHAEKVRNLKDMGYVAGLYGAAITAWTNALFAANYRYPLLDKARHDLIMALPHRPVNYDTRSSGLFTRVIHGELAGAAKDAAILHEEVAAICQMPPRT